MTAPDFTPAAIQQERERVLGLLEGITPGEWAIVPDSDDLHMLALIAPRAAMPHERLVEGESACSLVASIPNTTTGDAALICAAPALARKYADALAEIERLRVALKACAGILAGGDMTKRGLTDALELARAALASAPEVRP